MEGKMEENPVKDAEIGSEAGGEEALVGNVNKLAVSPPGYSGSPRKGHLVFDACFESGNLGRVDYISEFEFDLFIRPDTCNPRFRVWFNFTVENVRETQRVIFNVVNFSKTKSLYRDGMSPVVKSTSRPKWQRLPTKNVYYYRCPDHRRNYVMSFAFCFDREDDVYQFAYCYPYTYSRLQHYLASLERRNLPYLQREQLGLSVQQRHLDLLTITNRNFRPEHRSDFDDEKVYLVHTSQRNGSTGQPCQAHILALADTVEELEDFIMQKKMKIPKMSIKSSGNSVANSFGEERMPLRHKKALTQDHGRPISNSSKSLAAVVARLERNAASSCMEGEEDLDEDRLAEEGDDADDEDEDMVAEHHRQQQQQQQPPQQHLEVDSDVAAAVVPRVLYEELVLSYRQQEEEMRSLQQDLERTRRQLVQQTKKLKEYGSLLTEVKELRDFNRRLQDVLLMRLGSEPMHDNGTQTIKAEVVEPIVEAQETFREEANTSSSYSPSPRTVYTCNDGKVHLGGGIWVEEEKWHQLQRTQGDSKFTKNLAVMIWGTETLKNRSVTGVATKKKKDALPKPPLSPSKLKIVRECLYDRVSQETADSAEITQRLSKVNKYICEKIMDINKSIKNEERRESKLLIRQTVKMENFNYDGM
ncbi:BEN domain-containing protein 5-like isoform X1 [Dunckerocampus dactyliophorus]|uniref:BEN domain-containing protein 5-like isoform X1 n=3 Tax=Dunckerocampus dactyliophorus TaxID=161453 RepID=UPI002404DE4B|nr:BEN domain-containing protein 5-like isoform X1 [Dunckerocampus dactyliophorus]